MPDPAYPNFEHLVDSNGKEYHVGPDDRGGGFIATPADSWEVLVTADTLQGALQSLDRFVGTPVAKTQEDYVRAAIEFANSDSSIPWAPGPNYDDYDDLPIYTWFDLSDLDREEVEEISMDYEVLSDGVSDPERFRGILDAQTAFLAWLDGHKRREAAYRDAHPTYNGVDPVWPEDETS